MQVLRTILQDLVERRLWPVAVLLLAGLVAVPTLLGGAGEPAAEAPVAAQTAVNDAADAAQVTVVERTTKVRLRGGATASPFHKTPPGSGDTGEEIAPAPSASGGSDVTGSVPSGTTSTYSAGADTGSSGAEGADSTPVSSGTRSKTSKPAKQGTAKVASYRVDLELGTPDGELQRKRNLARLTALPSAENPVFTFLGVLADRKTLVFVLSPGTTADGEGRCRPSFTDCETVEMRKGQTEIFEVAQADGTVKQYIVQVGDVRRVESKTAARAAIARARHSVAGQNWLRAVDRFEDDDELDAFDRYRYRPRTGLLVRAARRKAQGSDAAAARVTTVTRRGEVRVWRTRPKAR
jgi:hypothetical protein